MPPAPFRLMSRHRRVMLMQRCRRHAEPLFADAMPDAAAIDDAADMLLFRCHAVSLFRCYAIILRC